MLSVLVKTGPGNTTEMIRYLADYAYARKGKIDSTHLRRLTTLSAAKSVVEGFEYRLGQGLACVFLDDYMTAESIKYKSKGILRRELLAYLRIRQYLVIVIQ